MCLCCCANMTVCRVSSTSPSEVLLVIASFQHLFGNVDVAEISLFYSGKTIAVGKTPENLSGCGGQRDRSLGRSTLLHDTSTH